MRYTRFITLFLVVAVAAVGLSACDFSEQNYDIEPGDELEIQGPGEVAVPAGEASYYVIPFTINKQYTWSVTDADGNDVPFETRRDGEYLDVTFEEPGDYAISVSSSGEGEEYSGDISIATAYPDVASQLSRFGYSSLAAAFDAAELTDTLGTDGPFTVLAPTNEAFVAAFDTTEDGDLVMPSAVVLADLMQYHVLPTSLSSGDIGNAQTEGTLLEGEDVTFNVAGGTITVTDGNPDTDDAALDDDVDVPAVNGLFHSIDALLMPSVASVDFQDQEAGIDEDSDAHTVTVASVYLPANGYVVIEDGDGTQVSEVSDELDAGVSNGITLELNDDLTGEEEYSAAVYQDAALTTPFTRDGEDVADGAVITPPAE